MNRIDGYFRDPTLEQPRADYYIVRLPWDSFIVGRDDAARILAAMGGFEAPKVIRCQTVFGSVVYVRTDTVMFVRECTRAQRDAERRFWKEIDSEEDDSDEE